MTIKNIINPGVGNMLERRIKERLAINLKIIELETNNVLGFTENINSSGMMLMSVKRFSVGETIQVLLEIPKDEEEVDQLSLTAKCQWCDQVNPLLFNIGFHFIFQNPFVENYIQTAMTGLEAYVNKQN